MCEHLGLVFFCGCDVYNMKLVGIVAGEGYSSYIVYTVQTTVSYITLV